MVIKALLPLLCITTCIPVNAMNPNQPTPLSLKTINQSLNNYKQWQKVTQTPEFILCAKLLKKDPNSSSTKYKKALNSLHATKEFKKYINLANPLDPSTSSGQSEINT